MLDIGDLLDRAEAFRGQELAHHLVHVERLHEQVGALRELLLPASPIPRPRSGCRCRQPVSCEARRTFCPLPADRERELVVGHDELHAVGVLVERSTLATSAGWIAFDARSVAGSRPRDDVDLLAAELADDRLHARAVHADAGADRVDVDDRARSRRSWRASPARARRAFTSTMPS